LARLSSKSCRSVITVSSCRSLVCSAASTLGVMRWWSRSGCRALLSDAAADALSVLTD
jgi:hypothetical protein